MERFFYVLCSIGRSNAGGCHSSKTWCWAILCWLLAGPVVATPLLGSQPSGTSAATLTEALNPDGTLQTGAQGAFDVRHFVMHTAPDGRPVFQPAGTGDENWQSGFNLLAANGTVNVVAQVGVDIYVGGDFTIIGGIYANRIAKWDGHAWSSLGTGAANGVRHSTSRYGSVNALAVVGTTLYVGGDFDTAGSGPASLVAKWDGTNWSKLGIGTANGIDVARTENYSVSSLVVAPTGELYVGGDFRFASGQLVNHVAKWDGAKWSGLGVGAAAGVGSQAGPIALAVGPAGVLYVGGLFNSAGNGTAHNIAQWDGNNWSGLGTGTGVANGVNDGVYAIVVTSAGEVYAGGEFTAAGGLAANHIAKWNGTSWSSLGTGATNGVDGPVVALVATSSGLYVGGSFALAGGAAASNIAKWTGTNWAALQVGATTGVDGGVATLAAVGTTLYAGGRFNVAGGTTTGHLAQWNGAQWSSLGAGTGQGVDGVINALAVAANGDIYVGGSFGLAGGVIANNIAKWNGTSWSSLGTGAANGVDVTVFTLAVAGDNLYVGGNFHLAGGIQTDGLARWDGTIWHAVGSANPNGAVTALAVSGKDLYAGGYFTKVGDVAANYVARWDGTAWHSLGTGATNGVSYWVFALAVSGNNVYVGGFFEAAGSQVANNVARWDGTNWSSLGTGTANGTDKIVSALAVTPAGDVYVGGDFTLAGGTTARSLARWNGTSWTSLGLAGVVYTLAYVGTNLYVGGEYSSIAGAAFSNIARWDGTSWHSLGTGLNGPVYELAAGPLGSLIAGGNFSAVGDGSKMTVHFGIYSEAALLPTRVSLPLGSAALSVYPNPAGDSFSVTLPSVVRTIVVKASLLNMLGQVVRQQATTALAPGASLRVETTGLAPGTYLLHLQADGVVFTSRVTVQ